MEKNAQIAFFNGLADRWADLADRDDKKLRCLVELCGLRPGARLLDAACGTGLLTPYLLEKAPEHIVGVDFSPRMIELAKAGCADPRAEFVCMDVMELSGGGFDCAILNDAFPYFENRGSLIRQMHHLLRRGGRLMICHGQGRASLNASHQTLSPPLALPLPTAQTLGGTLSQYFDVDIIVDTGELYVVSGLRKNI